MRNIKKKNKKKNLTKPSEKNVTYYFLGNTNFSCTCGYNGITYDGKCKGCGNTARYHLERDYFSEFIFKFENKEYENHFVSSLFIDEIKRKKNDFIFSVRYDTLIFDKKTGTVTYSSDKGKEELSNHNSRATNRYYESEAFKLFEKSIEIIMPIFENLFLNRGMKYVDVKSLIKKRNGVEHCLTMLKYPALQNFPLQEVYDIPKKFQESLKTLMSGDDLWKLFTNHNSKKIKEFTNTAEKFNQAIIFGPFIKQPENLYNLLFSFQEDVNL